MTDLADATFDTEVDEELFLATTGQKEETLSVGTSKHADVIALQELMGEAGHELEIDGIFGPQTRQAVEAFQKEQGLKVDGVVGQVTLKALSKVKPPKEATSSTNPSIDAIRSFVPSNVAEGAGKTGSTVAKGVGSNTSKSKTPKTPKGPHGGTIDAATGKETASASTGPIGSTTEGKFGKTGDGDPLTGSGEFNSQHPRNPAGEFIKKGDSGEQVAKLQKQLNKTGANLKVDGSFGPKTQQVVENFQAHNENSKGKPLAVDGIVGFQTAGSLSRAVHNLKE